MFLHGEEWSRIVGKRNFISFTDDIDTALDYASISSTEEKFNRESFPVIIGMSSNDLDKMKTCRVNSDLPEVGIKDSVSLEHIKSISVPEDKVEYVRKLIGNNNILVTPMNIENKFYYVDTEFREVDFDAEKAKQIAEAKKQATKKEFNFKEILGMIKSRKISEIRDIFSKIKEKINIRGKENGQDSRDK